MVHLIFGTLLDLGKFEQSYKQFHQKCRVLGDVTLKILGISIEHISKTTKARDFKFGLQLHLGKSHRAANNFLKTWRGLSHMTHKILRIPSNVFPTALKLETSNMGRNFT